MNTTSTITRCSLALLALLSLTAITNTQAQSSPQAEDITTTRNGIANQAPQNIIAVTENTLHGEVKYVPIKITGKPYLVRQSQTQRQSISVINPRATFPELHKKSRNIDVLMNEITGIAQPRKARSEQEIWTRFRQVWAFGRKHIYTDTQLLPQVNRDSAKRRTSIEDYTLAYRRFKKMPVGTCYSTAHAYMTLALRAGVPADRIAMATAYYGKTKSHVYLALRVDGRWMYFDPSLNRSLPMPHTNVTQVHSQGGSAFPVDYQHPILLRYAANFKHAHRMPLLEKAPD